MKNYNKAKRIFILFLLLNGLQSNAATLKVLEVDSSRGKISLQGALRAASADAAALYQIKETSGAVQTLQTKATPVNLWILADTSALCEAYKMDNYINTVLTQLPKVLSSESLVSVLSYTQDTKTILASNVSPLSAADIKVECQAGTLSASFEEAVEQAMTQSSKNNLQTQVWVYSSGNISLEAKTKQLILDKDIGINLSLYVPLVFQELQPLFSSTSKVLGDNFFYSILKQDTKSDLKNSVIIPEQRFSAEFSPSMNTQGSTSSFHLEALKSGKQPTLMASTQFHALVRKGWIYTLLDSIFFKIIFILLVFYFLYKIIKSYFPKQCIKCNKTLKFTEECCLFCHDTQNPSLILQQGQDEAVSTQTLALKGSNTTLFDGRYGITNKGSKKKALLRIEKRIQQGQEAFAIIPIKYQNKPQLVPPVLNGKALETPIFLTSGDTFVLNSTSITFLTGETHEKSN